MAWTWFKDLLAWERKDTISLVALLVSSAALYNSCASTRRSDELTLQQLIGEADELIGSAISYPQPVGGRVSADSPEAWAQRRQAQLKLQRALILDPNSAAAHRSLARLYFTILEFPKALTEIAIAIRLAPREADAHSLKGHIFLSLHNDIEAARAYKTALSLDHNNILALNGMAEIASRSGRYSEAQTYLSQATTADQNDALSEYNLALVLEKEDRDDEAEAALRRGVMLRTERMPSRSILEILIALAAIQAKQSDFVDVEGALRRALELHRTDTIATCNLAIVLAEESDNLPEVPAVAKLKEAENLLTSAVALSPGSAQLQYNLAVFLVQHKRFAEAEPHLVIAQSLDQNTESISNLLRFTERVLKKKRVGR